MRSSLLRKPGTLGQLNILRRYSSVKFTTMNISDISLTTTVRTRVVAALVGAVKDIL